MGNIYFLLGGARSGKSSYAEELAASLSEKVAYIATAKVTDIEMKKRIEAHRKRRPDTWATFEVEGNKLTISYIEKVIESINKKNYEAVLIDCITNMLFRILEKFEIENKEIISNEEEKQIEDYVLGFFSKFLKILKNESFDIIIVSNEVGMGIVPAYPLGRVFRDIMGATNKKIAAAADEVYFFISGLKQKLK